VIGGGSERRFAHSGRGVDVVVATVLEDGIHDLDGASTVTSAAALLSR
jgi:hypothetical protein